MKDLNTIPYFDPVDKLSEILCNQTRSRDPLFFRLLVSYYMVKAASMMRASVIEPGGEKIPINMYVLNLAASGYGKGRAANLLEHQVLKEFRERFLDVTFPEMAEKNLKRLSMQRAAKKGTPADSELLELVAEFENHGPIYFSFDSGTTPAVKQMRQKMMLAKAASINMEIDEIGNNLLGQTEVLNTFLELFDLGIVKEKLVKNTNDNRRSIQLFDSTPANMMLYGTPVKLLDGGKNEDELISMLDTGYARRCFFGYTRRIERDSELTPQELLARAQNTQTDAYIKQIAHHFGKLADSVNFGIELPMSEPVALELYDYQLYCEKRAEVFEEHREMQRTEMSHRYFKTMKLAGAYAFIDGAKEIEEQHLYHAIKLAEDSGNAFHLINNRDRPYMRLAKYLADIGHDVTQNELVEDLPFYKGHESTKREMVELATSWGAKNNIVIKKFTGDDGVTYFRGDTLQETNLDKMVVSYSTDVAVGYLSEEISLQNLLQLCQASGYHFINHKLGDIQ